VLHFSQTDLGKVLWIPPLGWEAGYFAWGWIFDRWAAEKDRPAFMFMLLAVLAIPFGFTDRSRSAAVVLALFFWCMFITGGFQMLGLRTGARAYPGERTASVAGVASGAWAAEAALILPMTGRWFDEQRFGPIFWFVALTPLAAAWLVVPSTMYRAAAAPPERCACAFPATASPRLTVVTASIAFVRFQATELRFHATDRRFHATDRCCSAVRPSLIASAPLAPSPNPCSEGDAVRSGLTTHGDVVI